MHYFKRKWRVSSLLRTVVESDSSKFPFQRIEHAIITWWQIWIVERVFRYCPEQNLEFFACLGENNNISFLENPVFFTDTQVLLAVDGVSIFCHVGSEYSTFVV